MTTRFDDWEGQYLEHYGVLGMKWGVRKDPHSAYQKATEKRRKLERRATRALSKSVKANSTLVKAKRKYEVNQDAADKYSKKAAKAKDASKSARKGEKAAKYQSKADNMQKLIRKYELRASKADLKKDKATLKGKKWCEAMLKTFNEPSMEALERKYGKG